MEFTIFLLLLSVSLALGFFYLLWFTRRDKREYEAQQSDLLHKYYEVSLLNSLVDMAGQSVDFSQIPAFVVSASEKFIPMSVAMYCTYSDGNMYTSTTVREGVSQEYLSAVKKILLSSFTSATGVTNYTITKEDVHNDFLKTSRTYSDHVPQSYFNVPFVYKGMIVGMLCISSVRKDAFSEPDMDLFYQVVARVSRAYVNLSDYVASQQTSLSTLVATLPGGAMMFSVDGEDVRLTFMNSTARQYLRIHGEASAVAVLSTFSRDDDLLGKLHEALRDKKCILVSETQVFDKYFKIYINPIVHEDKVSTTVSVTLQDTTLEREIAEIRENFMHSVVHELRAPMTSIKGASDLLLNKDLPEEEKHKMLEMIHAQTERMLSDVADLLDAAKIDSGKMSVVTAQADIDAVIKERVETFTYLAREKKIEIQMQLAPIPQFSFDSMRIGQVVNNLISNALKYTNGGGKVVITSQVKDGRCIVSISDNGLGIPDDKKSVLFTKFGQAGNVASPKAGGSSGLGLYIVKGIIDSHGGEIWVDSHVGQGTTVSFYLPMKQEGAGLHVEDGSKQSISSVSQGLSGQQVAN